MTTTGEDVELQRIAESSTKAEDVAKLTAHDILIFSGLEILGVCAVVGNLALILVLLTNKYLSRASFVLILSLAVADVLHGLVTTLFFYPPILLKQLHLDDFGVRLFNVIDWTAWSITLTHMIAICADRHVAIILYSRYSQIVTVQRALNFTIFCWLFFLILNAFFLSVNACCMIRPLSKQNYYTFGYEETGRFNAYMWTYTPLEVFTICVLTVSNPITLLQLYRRHRRKLALRVQDGARRLSQRHHRTDKKSQSSREPKRKMRQTKLVTVAAAASASSPPSQPPMHRYRNGGAHPAAASSSATHQPQPKVRRMAMMRSGQQPSASSVLAVSSALVLTASGCATGKKKPAPPQPPPPPPPPPQRRSGSALTGQEKKAGAMLLEMSIKMGAQTEARQLREAANRRATRQQYRILVQITAVALIFYSYMAAYYASYYTITLQTTAAMIFNSFFYSTTHMINPVIYFAFNKDMRHQLKRSFHMLAARVARGVGDSSEWNSKGASRTTTPRFGGRASSLKRTAGGGAPSESSPLVLINNTNNNNNNSLMLTTSQNHTSCSQLGRCPSSVYIGDGAMPAPLPLIQECRPSTSSGCSISSLDAVQQQQQPSTSATTAVAVAWGNQGGEHELGQQQEQQKEPDRPPRKRTLHLSTVVPERRRSAGVELWDRLWRVIKGDNDDDDDDVPIGDAIPDGRTHIKLGVKQSVSFDTSTKLYGGGGGGGTSSSYLVDFRRAAELGAVRKDYDRISTSSSSSSSTNTPEKEVSSERLRRSFASVFEQRVTGLLAHSAGSLLQAVSPISSRRSSRGATVEKAADCAILMADDDDVEEGGGGEENHNWNSGEEYYL